MYTGYTSDCFVSYSLVFKFVETELIKFAWKSSQMKFSGVLPESRTRVRPGFVNKNASCSGGGQGMFL